jgi:hypothetical protein
LAARHRRAHIHAIETVLPTSQNPRRMKMRDDYLSADWANGHHQVSGAIHKAFRLFMESMDRLNAHQFDAPWGHRAKPRAGTGR